MKSPFPIIICFTGLNKAPLFIIREKIISFTPDPELPEPTTIISVSTEAGLADVPVLGEIEKVIGIYSCTG